MTDDVIGRMRHQMKCRHRRWTAMGMLVRRCRKCGQERLRDDLVVSPGPSWENRPDDGSIEFGICLGWPSGQWQEVMGTIHPEGAEPIREKIAPR
jgi:hypothetical protein